MVPWVGGQRLAVRRGMTGATGNIYVGLQEFAGMMLPLHFLRPADLFFDIGANVGTYTVLASGVCGARTWAFEPAPETTPLLRRNISLNGLDGLVRVFDVALGAQDGEAFFTTGEGPENRIIAAEAPESRRVQQRRLDTLIGADCPTMIKMDVEGHEEDALIGAETALAAHELKIITLETVTPRIRSLLTERNFTVVHYDPFSRTLADEPVGAPADTVFVRDRDFVAARLATSKPVKILGREI